MKKLKRNLNELFERGWKFLKDIETDEKNLLIYHTDPDGVCSAALVILELKKLGIKINRRFYTSNIASTQLKDEMEKADKIIMVDVALDTLNFPKKKNILIFDHHPSKDVNSKDVILVNPMLQNSKLYQPVSYILYKFFSQFLDMKEQEWIAALGTVADFGYGDCKDLMKKYISKRPKDLKKTRLGELSDRLNSCINYFGVNGALNFLLSLKSLEIFEKNKRAEFLQKKFEKNLEEAKQEFMKNAEVDKKLIFGVIESRQRRMGSTLASVISAENPKKVLIILSKNNGVYNVHARNISKDVDVGKLMKNCCDAEGGGHKQAAGGTVKNFEKFRACILKNIKNFTVKRS